MKKVCVYVWLHRIFWNKIEQVFDKYPPSFVKKHKKIVIFRRFFVKNAQILFFSVSVKHFLWHNILYLLNFSQLHIVAWTRLFTKQQLYTNIHIYNHIYYIHLYKYTIILIYLYTIIQLYNDSIVYNKKNICSKKARYQSTLFSYTFNV